MIGTIARKEFIEIVRDGRFRWVAAIMVLLLLTAMLAGKQRYDAYAATQLAAQGSSNAQWLDQGDKNPHSAAHYGNYAFKPLGPLGFFDGGMAVGHLVRFRHETVEAGRHREQVGAGALDLVLQAAQAVDAAFFLFPAAHQLGLAGA